MRMFHRIDPFELPGFDGSLVQSDHFRGRYLVLYFYPKANTSGCTREARDFTARRAELEALDAAVVGVSPDKPATIERFVQRHELDLPLASDPRLELAERFGAVKPQGGVLRSTFLIDRAGVLRHQWKGVKVDGHVDDVVAVLGELRDADAEVSPLMHLRRSKRAISSEPIAEGDLWKLVEAATLAPSCYNNQPWRMMVATGEKLDQVKEALSKGNAWALRSPAIVVLAARREDDCTSSEGRDYYLFGCGMAAMNLMLQATGMGLIAHPIAGYTPAKVREALEIPEDYAVVTLIILGRPGSLEGLKPWQLETELGPRQRYDLDQVAGWNRFVAPD